MASQFWQWTDALRTADPFKAGWFLSAYFLGGYGEDGRGANGLSNAVIAAAKSWGLGIPVSFLFSPNFNYSSDHKFITVGIICWLYLQVKSWEMGIQTWDL
ncbi:hypothetical protein CRYUN_Cryun35bG0042100 [Craigia yunnanensis]